MYPPQTKVYIQRLLRWLVYGVVDFPKICSGPKTRARLELSMLCKAISVETDGYLPLDAAIPTPERLFGWLGCLVRRSASGSMTLSHFTVREFLSMNPEDVSSFPAREYLVCPTDVNYILKTCLTYVMHENFKNKTYSTMGEIEIILAKDYLLEYIAITIFNYMWASADETLDDQCQSLIRKFLSIPSHQSFELLDVCDVWLSCSDRREVLGSERTKRNMPSPLHFAAGTGLTKEVQRMLDSRIPPDGLNPTVENEAVPTPLHLAICVGNDPGIKFDEGITTIWILCDNFSIIEKKDMVHEELSLQVVKMLVDSGADVDRKLLIMIQVVFGGCETMKALVTPLTLAIICCCWRAANALLDAGASWEAVARVDLMMTNYDENLCSIESLLNNMPRYEENIKRAIERSGRHELRKALANWRLSRSTQDSIDQLINDSSDDITPQGRLFEAFRDEDWEAVREILAGPAKIEINHNDADGLNAIFRVSDCEGEGSTLIHLLEHGADPNLLTSEGLSALHNAASEGFCDNVISLLQFGANLEYRETGGWTPSLLAVYYRRYEALELLLENGADISAALDDGTGALHLAIQQMDTKMFSLLLAHKADPTTPDNYGSTPLHEACRQGLEAEVENLIERVRTDPVEYVNSESLMRGTPLYISARFGSNSILARLLDAGAEIDKVAPGNLLGSALMVACAQGHSETVKLLLSRGASLEVEGSRFGTAAGTTRAFRKEGILKILEEHVSPSRVEEVVDDEMDES